MLHLQSHESDTKACEIIIMRIVTRNNNITSGSPAEWSISSIIICPAEHGMLSASQAQDIEYLWWHYQVKTLPVFPGEIKAENLSAVVFTFSVTRWTWCIIIQYRANNMHVSLWLSRDVWSHSLLDPLKSRWCVNTRWRCLYGYCFFWAII